MGRNLPPGVSVSDIPGNRPEDIRHQKMMDRLASERDDWEDLSPEERQEAVMEEEQRQRELAEEQAMEEQRLQEALEQEPPREPEGSPVIIPPEEREESGE